MTSSERKKRIILVGKAASGKDHARKLLQELGLTYQPGYTTRPPRSGEVDGIDYHFISPESFDMADRSFFYETVSFNGWNYGTSVEQFHTSRSVFIMTPSGVSKIAEEDRRESLIIYFDIPEDVRRSRLSKRGDNNDAMERRLKADASDFESFSTYDIHVAEPLFTKTFLSYFVDTRLEEAIEEKVPKVVVNGREIMYKEVINHSTITVGLTFAERIRLLFGASLEVTSKIYMEDICRPLASEAKGVVSKLFKRKSKPVQMTDRPGIFLNQIGVGGKIFLPVRQLVLNIYFKLEGIKMEG